MAQGSTVQSARPFIGRRHEVDWLARSLQDAIGCEPRVALLTGEAGMGKTRLLTELRRTAARGRVQVCTGRCHESSSTPYLPFLQTLAAQVEQAGGNLDACAGADAAGAVVATRAPCSSLQSAARSHAPLRGFYERLVGRGKPKKAALAAVARKLLVAINAMIRDRRGWQPALVVQPSCC